jgi:guanylate kinase
MITEKHQPIIFLISAPSGAGKTTLCDMLREEFKGTLRGVVTVTTRPPRPGEVEGASYRFFSAADFELHATAGAFLEQATVHGYRYGTPRGTVTHILHRGQDVLLNVDVQGAASVRAALHVAPPGSELCVPLVDIFIAPPSFETLQARLTERGQDSAEVIERRLQQAAIEMDRYSEFQYLVINDDLLVAYDKLRAIVLAERARIRK